MSDKDNDGLQDKSEALELLRDEADKIGMTGFGRLGIEKLQIAIDEFKAQLAIDAKEEPKKEAEPEQDFWKVM